MITETHGLIGRRLLAAFMAAVLVAGMTFAVPVGQASAAGGEQLAVGAMQLDTQAQEAVLYPNTLWVGMKYPMSISIGNFPDNGKVTKITSSNTKVLKAVKTGTRSYDNQLIPKNAGSSKVTVTYKVGSATKTASATYTVKKFPKPFSSIKVNNQNVALPTAATYQMGASILGFAGTKVTPKVTMENGWTLDYMSYSVRTNSSGSYSSKKTENGKSFSLANGKNATINISVSNSSGDYLTYSINVRRGGPLDFYKSTLFVGEDSNAPLSLGSALDEKTVKLVSIASSNKGVLTAKKVGTDYYSTALKAKKLGKSTVTVKYKYKGKTYTAKETITVKAYPNPMKSLTINGKAVNLAKNKFRYADFSFKSGKAKVSVKPASGWRLGSIYLYIEGKRSGSEIGDGKTVTLPKSKYASYSVNLYNSKNESFLYSVSLARK